MTLLGRSIPEVHPLTLLGRSVRRVNEVHCVRILLDYHLPRLEDMGGRREVSRH